jgi:hypothetical protein
LLVINYIVSHGYCNYNSIISSAYQNSDNFKMVILLLLHRKLNLCQRKIHQNEIMWNNLLVAYKEQALKWWCIVLACDNLRDILSSNIERLLLSIERKQYMTYVCCAIILVIKQNILYAIKAPHAIQYEYEKVNLSHVIRKSIT